MKEMYSEYEKLKTRYPAEEAKARFFRFFLWYCKKAGRNPVDTGEAYRSFLHQHRLFAAFTDYLDVAAQFPLINTEMHSADFQAKTGDSRTVIDHQTMSFGEDMTQEEKHELLLKLNVTCCFANKDGFKVKTTGTHQAFFVTRHNDKLFISKFDHPIQSMNIDGILPDREIFVILVSGDTPVSAEEMKALLEKHPLPVETLSTQLAQEISTENGKAPIAISILPIDRNSKTLQYAAHISGDDTEFQQRLEALPDFDNYKKLKEEVARLTQRTQDYLLKLREELTSEKQAFLDDHPNSLIDSDNEDGEEKDVHISGPNINDEAQRKFNNTIGEKAKLRFEVSQTLKKLKTDDKTPLEKLKDFSESLFGKNQENVEVARTANSDMEPVEGAPLVIAAESLTLAKKIENTKTGLDYLKAILRTLAAFSIVLTIPTVAYCFSTHRWPWQTEGKGLLRQSKDTINHFQTLQR